MTKRNKKKNAFFTHDYTVTTVTPTGEQQVIFTARGSRDAFRKQVALEKDGYLVTVFNRTLDSEEYRNPLISVFKNFCS